MIELRPHIGRHVLKRDVEVHNHQYMIMMDGRLIGFLPYKQGSRPLLIARIGPIEQQELESELRALVGSNYQLGKCMVPPNPPQEIESEDDDIDPFDAFEERQGEV